MGFKKNTYYECVNNVIVMPYCCNFSGINSFNVKVCNISTTKNVNSYEKSISSILGTIQVNGQQNNMIYYTQPFNYNFDVNEHTIDNLQIDIQDDLNNYIDFNNQSWNLTLLFQVSYNNKIVDKDTFYDITGTILSHPQMEL